MTNVIIDVKSKIHPWIRLNRIVRDIPAQYIFNENSPHMRDHLKILMEKQGKYCKCIRCREIGESKVQSKNISYMKRTYESSHGMEYFLSYEEKDTPRDTLLGFLRLRFPPKDSTWSLPSLQNTALIRELHVYGKMVPVHKRGSSAQHIGIGTLLLRKAELLATLKGYTKIAVISGVGARNYYRKKGYTEIDENGFMFKRLNGIYYFASCIFVLSVAICCSFV